MRDELQHMLKDLWNSLPTQIDRLDPGHLLNLLQRLHHDDRAHLGLAGLQAMQTALLAEAERRHNRHRAALEGYLKMAAQAALPAAWGFDRETWWQRLESSLNDRQKSPQDIENEHALWAQIAAVWNQPTPLLAMATAERARATKSSDAEVFLLPEATRIGYLQQAAAMNSAEARGLIEKMQRQKRARDNAATPLASAPLPSLPSSIEARPAHQLADDLGKKILEHLEHNHTSKDVDQLRLAREAALQMPADDFRRAGFLGLIDRTLAEQTPEEDKRYSIYQQASRHFLEAFELGDQRALWYAAVCKYLAQDKPGYLALLQKGLQQRDPECIFALAQETIHENETTAIGLVIQAAKLGHAKALANCRSNEAAYRRRGFGSDLDQLNPSSEPKP
jgi:hypothetical protein